MLEGDSNTLELGHEVLEEINARGEHTEGMVGVRTPGLKMSGVMLCDGLDLPEPR
jgi:hypothetical protein